MAITTALAILFALLPTYLIRFHIGPLPTTLLEVIIWIILMAWLIQNRRRILNFKFFPLRGISRRETIFKKLLVTGYWLLVTGTALFLIGATISIFTSVNLRAALGEWKAFYVEPVLIFLVLATTLRANTPPARLDSAKRAKGGLGGVNAVIFSLVLCGLVTSIFAIYQHFTGWGVPYAFWENHGTYRVTAWYGFPNAVGLFLAPLVPLAIYNVKRMYETLKNKRYMIHDRGNNIYHLSFIFYIIGFLCSLLFIPAAFLAIVFAKSTGALIGLLAGMFILLFFYKKTRIATIIVLISGIITLTLLPATNPIKQELLFRDRSGQIRVAIYKETLQLLKDRPILGAGLASYSERIQSYHTTVNGEGIEIFHHPHNIFLTMWVNTGIIGLVGFVLIIVWFFYYGLRVTGYGLRIFLLSSMFALLVSGLVDSPYIKNDLALLFWLLPALLITCNTHNFENV